MKRIALLGLGQVGQGFYEVFEHEKARVAAMTGVSLDLGAVLVQDTKKPRNVMPREGLLINNPDRIIDDTTTDAIVDAINESALGLRMAVAALTHGKHFVTADKALVSSHFEQLHALANRHGAAFLYEASVGGGTPLLKPLRALERAGEIASLRGILNGSCNYILTGMRDEGASYDEMIARASALGYLEADPRDDLEGYDTRRKLRILCCVAFGGSVPETDIPCHGITRLREQDIGALGSHGMEVKLLGAARREGTGVAAFVFPCAVPRLTPLAGIGGPLNLVEVTSQYLGRAGFMGQGAGSRPTGHALFTDLMDAIGDTSGLSPRLGRAPNAVDTTARFYLRGPDIPAGWADGTLGEGKKTHPRKLSEVLAWLQSHDTACAVMLEE